MARHADLAAIVERQDGSEAARARVAAFLRMASGEATVEETATGGRPCAGMVATSCSVASRSLSASSLASS